MYFFSETRPLLGHFLKKVFFAPLKCQTLVKIFKIPKSTKKWLTTGSKVQGSQNLPGSSKIKELTSKSNGELLIGLLHTTQEPGSVPYVPENPII